MVSYKGDKKLYSYEILNVTFLVSDISSMPDLQAGEQKATAIKGTERTLYEKIGNDWYKTPITVIDGQIETAGLNFVEWDGMDRQDRPMGAGVYFYRLDAGAHHEARCMVLAR